MAVAKYKHRRNAYFADDVSEELHTNPFVKREKIEVVRNVRLVQIVHEGPRWNAIFKFFLILV